MLKNLGWESYVSVVEDSIQIINLLDILADLSDGQICPAEKAILLPKTDNGYTNVYKEIMESKMYLNVVVIIKSFVEHNIPYTAINQVCFFAFFYFFCPPKRLQGLRQNYLLKGFSMREIQRSVSSLRKFTFSCYTSPNHIFFKIFRTPMGFNLQRQNFIL